MGAPSKRARKIRDASEFDINRLSAALAMPKDGRIRLTSWSLADIFNARDLQLLGQFYLPARMAESMQTDDALYVALENRLAPQRCIPVELVAAANKGPRGASVAGEAAALFGQSGVGISPDTLASIHSCLVQHDVAFGVNVATPRGDGTRIDFEHHVWPIEYVRWDPVVRMFKARVDPSSVPPDEISKAAMDAGIYGMIGGFEVPIIHGDGRWTVYRRFEIDPFKHGSLLSAALVWARHAYAIRDWAKGSVAHGSAKVIGEMPAGVPLQDANGITPEAQAMADLLRAIATSDAPVGIRPAGSKTDFLTNTSTAWQVWSELVGNAERAAARIYLGTDGILGAQGGAPGVDIAALFGVATTKVQSDLACITRGLQTGVIEPWCALNFGDSSLAPTRKYMMPDAEADAERASRATRRAAFFVDIKSARDNGFDVTQTFVDDVADQYGIEPPTLLAASELGPTAMLTTKDVAGIVITVNEARASAGLGPLLLPTGAADPSGFMTIGAYNAGVIAKSDIATAPSVVPPPASSPPAAAPAA